jgi:hypothetical protein
LLLALPAAGVLIVSSGHSNDPVLSDYKAHGFCAAVTKPFMIEELNHTVEMALQKKSRR